MQLPVTGYRPDIDGLRAVAVLSVLAYHYGFTLPGGFTGVDVFFVISGFLITSRLRDDLAAGAFSVLGFYDRRVRRILPALVVMLAVTLFAGKFLLIPSEYKALADSAATAAFGVSNFYFRSHTGYFDLHATLVPLLHTWSLGVEEQFYIVWPLLLFVVASGRSMIFAAAAVTAMVMIGFGVSLIWFEIDPKSAFFMTAPRAWELAMGAALVFLPALSRTVGEIATALGVALICAAFLVLSDASFPGSSALLPSIGAALVIWPRRSQTTLAGWLGYLSPIGLISYSLYLWHWPVWVMFRIYINNTAPRSSEALALALVAVLLAVLSYWFVERPFRTRRWQPAQNVWAGLAACMLIFCASMYIDSSDGFPARVPREAYADRSLEAMWAWPCKEIPISPGGQPHCVFGAPWDDGVEKAVLWGDSHAEHMAPLLNPGATRANVAVALYTLCPAVVGTAVLGARIETNYNEKCEASRTALFALLAQQPGIKTVILSAAWPALINRLQGAGPLSRETSKEKLLEIALTDVISRLSALNRKIVLVATVPSWSHWYYVPCALYGKVLLRRPCGEQEMHLKRSQYLETHAANLRVFQRIAAAHPGVQLIVPGDAMCRAENCITVLDGEDLYRDNNHIRRNLRETTNVDLARLMGLDAIFAR
jgi:peptidoglycan/LPS O-acetylase OafA/YrhL